jgi:hypothetical protein
MRSGYALLSAILIASTQIHASPTRSVGVKNGYPGISIWVTLYSADPIIGSVRNIVTARCVPSGVEAVLSGDFDYANSYVRSELKQRLDCGGDTIDDTTVNVGALPSNPNWVTLLPQASFPKTYWAQGRLGVAPPIQTTLPAPTETVVFSRIKDRDGQPMVLSIDVNNSNCRQGGPDGLCGVVIARYVPGSASQTWLRQKTANGYLFTNKATAMIAHIAPGNGNRVLLIGLTSLNIISSVWTIGGDIRTNCAIRPFSDSNQNLNVFGNGPYNAGSPVGTWGWSGGDVNETWYMNA